MISKWQQQTKTFSKGVTRYMLAKNELFWLICNKYMLLTLFGKIIHRTFVSLKKLSHLAQPWLDRYRYRPISAIFADIGICWYIGILPISVSADISVFLADTTLFSYHLSNSIFAALLGGKATWKVGLPLSYSNSCFNWCIEAFFN